MAGLAMTSLAACDWSPRTEPRPFSSMITIISHPEVYNGERVFIQGYARMRPRHDRDVIYYSCDDLLNSNRVHGIPFSVLDEILTYEEAAALDGRYVSLAGNFEFPVLVDDRELMIITEVEHLEAIEGEGILRPSCFE